MRQNGDLLSTVTSYWTLAEPRWFGPAGRLGVGDHGIGRGSATFHGMQKRTPVMIGAGRRGSGLEVAVSRSAGRTACTLHRMQCGDCGHDNPEVARFCMNCAAALGTATVVAQKPTTVGAGRYRIDRLLGEGARKVVYAATDERLGRDVAVAVIKTEGLDDAGRRRIAREARAMARLGDHPNIVTVFDVGEDDGQPFIVSELMPGGSVTD